jgi:hypothetical protein
LHPLKMKSSLAMFIFTMQSAAVGPDRSKLRTSYAYF